MKTKNYKYLTFFLLLAAFSNQSYAATISLEGTVKSVLIDSSYTDWERNSGEAVGALLAIQIDLEKGYNFPKCNQKKQAFAVRLGQSGAEATYAAALTAMHNKTKVKVNVYVDDCKKYKNRQEINYLVTYPPK